MSVADDRSAPSDQTRLALVTAAIRLFGQKGFEGTSTRQIAALAKANIGSIAYHFGGKAGLRMAAADHIVETIRAIAVPALGAMEASAPQPLDAAEARRRIMAALERMAGFVLPRPKAGDIVQFVLREMAHPSPALERIYAGVFEPAHRRLCAVWEAATGEPAEAESTKLRVFTLIGQVVYFRIAREAVLRRMDWADIGQAEARKVSAIAAANIEALLAAPGKDRR